MSNYKLYQGDCLEVMKDIKDGSVDLVVKDWLLGILPMLMVRNLIIFGLHLSKPYFAPLASS